MAPTQDIINRVLKFVNSEELIKLTSDLVRINTVWDPVAGTSEQPAADYVFKWAREQGFEAIMEEVAPGRSNVIVTWSVGSRQSQVDV